MGYIVYIFTVNIQKHPHGLEVGGKRGSKIHRKQSLDMNVASSEGKTSDPTLSSILHVLIKQLVVEFLKEPPNNVN